MTQITRLGIEKTRKLLKDQGFELQISKAALDELAKEGYDPVYGARPLRRLIQTAIENPISLEIISRKFIAGDTILIDFDSNGDKFTFAKLAPQSKVEETTPQQQSSQDTTAVSASAQSNPVYGAPIQANGTPAQNPVAGSDEIPSGGGVQMQKTV